MGLRIEIDTDRCTGHGRCYSLAPELFGCDDDGYGVVVAADVTEAQADAARRAVRSCPERAVTLP